MPEEGALPAGSCSRRRLLAGATVALLPPLFSAAQASSARADLVGGRVPILAYHGVGYAGDQYSVTPEQLVSQCQWLTTNGYTVVSLGEFWSACQGAGGLPTNSVVLTNDDGQPSAFQFAEVLAQHGMRATYFVNNLSPITPEQIAMLAQYGMVQAHTVSHVSLAGLPYEAQMAEIGGNRSYLEGITGQPVMFLAWPFGASDPSAIDAAIACGIVGALSLGGTAANTGAASPYALPRIMIESTDTIDTFAAKITSY